MIVTDGKNLKNYLNNHKTAVALGSFDALHKGHSAIIEKAIDYAKNNNCVSVVQIFDFPVGKNEKDIKCVNTLEKRLSLLKEMGVEVVAVEVFNEEFRKIDYREFVSMFLNDFYNAKAVFVGYNYTFGHMAKGNTGLLCEECTKYGVEVFIQDCVSLDKVVSSSNIREFISNGDMKKVKNYMGRPYTVSGVVVKGRRLGTKIGFPTANMDIPDNKVLPLCGVYKSSVKFDNREYPGITNVGGKPTVSKTDSNIETHIIGFSGDLYGKMIEVSFIEKIRDIYEFKSINELKSQLEKDKAFVVEGERNK